MRDTITAGLDARAAKAYEATAQPRALPWHECPLETKVERVRDELRDLRSALQYLLTEVHRIAALFDHSHDHQGRVVAPLSRHGHLSGGTEAGRSYDSLA